MDYLLNLENNIRLRWKAFKFVEKSTLLFIIGMLVLGSLNTILTKVQDSVCVENCEQPNEHQVYFEQPLFQTFNMFIGEVICLLSWYIFYHNNESQRYLRVGDNELELTNSEDTVNETNYVNYLYLVFPTLCDCTSSMLMSIALVQISPSVFQMLRGSVVIFTAILSTFFLKMVYNVYKWVSLVVIFIGIVIVGYSNFEAQNNTILGLLLIILAQIFSACQSVLEEYIMEEYQITPLLAVGLEGVFGIIIISIVSVIFQLTDVYDILKGFEQFVSFPEIYWTSIGITLSIPVFNWCSLSVTKRLSSTSRTTIDIGRTILIWIFSLSVGWEILKKLQIIGFLITISGILYFNS